MSRILLVSVSVAILLSGCSIKIETNGGDEASEPLNHETVPAYQTYEAPATTSAAVDPNADNGHLITKFTIEITRADTNGDGDTDATFRFYGRDDAFNAYRYRGEGKADLYQKDGSTWNRVGIGTVSADPSKFGQDASGTYTSMRYTSEFFTKTTDYQMRFEMTVTKTGQKKTQTLDFSFQQSKVAASSSSAAVAPLTFQMNDANDRLEVTSAPSGIDWGKLYVLTCEAGKFGINQAPTHAAASCSRYNQAPGGTAVKTGDMVNLCRQGGSAWLDAKIRWDKSLGDRPEYGPFKFQSVAACA